MSGARPAAEVTVVGAGPAGAMTAYHLAVRGLRVRLIERRAFPREKPCGGGLTRRALQEIPFDVSGVIEDVGRTVRLTHDNRLLMEGRVATPPIVLVRRDRFDALLVEKAIQAGVRFQDGTAFRKLTGTPGDLKIETSRESFRSRVIVGADGVGSRVRKALGCTGPNRSMFALEATVRPRGGPAGNRFQSRIDFDFHHTWAGYGWVFPKRRHLSVGIFSPHSRPGSMKPAFYGYLRAKGLADADLAGLRGHPIPWTASPTFHLSDGRGLLVGDAAGLCDPVSGEGIYAALCQARFAAESISDWFSAKNRLSAYEGRLRSALALDNACARWMRAFLYHAPGISRRFLSLRRCYLLRRYLAVACGETTYRAEFMPTALLRRLTGPARPHRAG